MNFFEKFKEDLVSDDLTVRNNAIFKLIAAVVISLVVICAIVVSAYDWISSDFERIQNVSIIGGLVITVALSWGSKAGNLRRILKSMLRDFEFYKFTTVDVGSLVFRFCHWIFWSALIASCFVRYFDASTRFWFVILCVFLLMLSRVSIEAAIALQRVAENTSPDDQKSLPGS
tara:strand:- start:145 stop:663 length:519 start_codon:yes stop_codon:yes gene_type:complete